MSNKNIVKIVTKVEEDRLLPGRENTVNVTNTAKLPDSEILKLVHQEFLIDSGTPAKTIDVPSVDELVEEDEAEEKDNFAEKDPKKN